MKISTKIYLKKHHTNKKDSLLHKTFRISEIWRRGRNLKHFMMDVE